MSDNAPPQYGAYPPAAQPAADLPPRSAAPTGGPGNAPSDFSNLTTPPTRQPQPRSKRKPLIIAAAVVLVAGLAAGGYGIYSKATAPKPIAAAATKCNLKAEVGDDGHTLSMFNVGAQEDQFPGPDGLDGLVCVTKALNMPARAFDHMLATSREDGWQEETWGGIKARWSFYPVKGVTVTFTD